MTNVTVTPIQPPPVEVTVQRPAVVVVQVTPSLVYTGEMNLDSPVFIGTPEVPTAPLDTVNGNVIANVDFVMKATRYTHVQTTEDTVWTVVHNMNKYPVLVVIDTLGETVIGTVEYLNLNTLTLTFSAPIAGEAYLS